MAAHVLPRTRASGRGLAYWGVAPPIPVPRVLSRLYFAEMADGRRPGQGCGGGGGGGPAGDRKTKPRFPSATLESTASCGGVGARGKDRGDVGDEPERRRRREVSRRFRPVLLSYPGGGREMRRRLESSGSWRDSVADSREAIPPFHSGSGLKHRKKERWGSGGDWSRAGGLGQRSLNAAGAAPRRALPGVSHRGRVAVLSLGHSLARVALPTSDMDGPHTPPQSVHSTLAEPSPYSVRPYGSTHTSDTRDGYGLRSTEYSTEYGPRMSRPLLASDAAVERGQRKAVHPVGQEPPSTAEPYESSTKYAPDAQASRPRFPGAAPQPLTSYDAEGASWVPRTRDFRAWRDPRRHRPVTQRRRRITNVTTPAALPTVLYLPTTWSSSRTVVGSSVRIANLGQLRCRVHEVPCLSLTRRSPACPRLPLPTLHRT